MRLRDFAPGAIALAVLVGACDSGPTSPRGFSLPNGDIAAGQAAFAKFQCADCHVVAGLEGLREGITPVMSLPLGGKTPRVQSYGELVTSIINPSHAVSRKFPGIEVDVDGRSKMPNYNYAMTVNELIDLVAFLQSKYQLEPFVVSPYPPYSYPPGI